MESSPDTLRGRAAAAARARPAAAAFVGVFVACLLTFLGLGCVLPVLSNPPVIEAIFVVTPSGR